MWYVVHLDRNSDFELRITRYLNTIIDDAISELGIDGNITFDLTSFDPGTSLIVKILDYFESKLGCIALVPEDIDNGGLGKTSEIWFKSEKEYLHFLLRLQ